MNTFETPSTYSNVNHLAKYSNLQLESDYSFVDGDQLITTEIGYDTSHNTDDIWNEFIDSNQVTEYETSRFKDYYPISEFNSLISVSVSSINGMSYIVVFNLPIDEQSFFILLQSIPKWYYIHW